MSKLYEIEVEKPNGETVAMSDYKGNVLLIVNTASKCGFAPQFAELQKLYEKYKENNFTVLGFPSDQFLNQEFDSTEETMEFCQMNYGVNFPMFKKMDVKGKDKHLLFEYLTENSKGLLSKEIKWNFTKFLVNESGEVIGRYAPKTNPKDIEKDIQAQLA
ncbi:glutathione peroxidase [Bacillus carboniphilus]|uniref:Glutathione peroxidase n=1 Tax=Bacillus carboniphilus TaxID=86663 RepID=A0ABY9JTP1_9BACI|nr:glutathione peroxidase [Bacillus carboniphilus]WLR42754.1 glutathione peroxidase [Bacillus carboniphilus]